MRDMRQLPSSSTTLVASILSRTLQRPTRLKHHILVLIVGLKLGCWDTWARCHYFQNRYTQTFMQW